MKTIGVVSDSHGETLVLNRIFEKLESCDVVVHLGDHEQDARCAKRPVTVVRGNCDWLSRENERVIFEIEGVNVMLTHGHKENVKMGLMRLSYRAQEENCALVLYGHTHSACITDTGCGLLVNPGAAKNGCYAIVRIENGVITPELLSL